MMAVSEEERVRLHAQAVALGRTTPYSIASIEQAQERLHEHGVPVDHILTVIAAVMKEANAAHISFHTLLDVYMWIAIMPIVKESPDERLRSRVRNIRTGWKFPRL